MTIKNTEKQADSDLPNGYRFTVVINRKYSLLAHANHNHIEPENIFSHTMRQGVKALLNTGPAQTALS